MTDSKQPTHDVFHVVGNGKNARWGAPIGAVWPHGDGKGFNLQLQAIPVAWDGKLTVRERLPKKQDDKDDRQGRLGETADDAAF